MMIWNGPKILILHQTPSVAQHFHPKGCPTAEAPPKCYLSSGVPLARP